MTLSAGTTIGPYEIVDEIGAGGMGVVYRATDTKLKRDVAIKVLPESLASDEERLTRFQREALLLASLNHPNIAQIHGLEDADGAMALVMELVEGPTLEDRIKQGALPPDEALGIATQIAEALEGAHGQGIIHRDLKPANIKLRPDGIVKVLDFGIAKALEPDTLTSEPASPMLTTPATQVGVILGTAAYMSPEQARGKQVDQRADIWAFGCVLYEMLTGQPVFAGEDVSITLARVLERETDFSALPSATTPPVRNTIQLCLQKDVRRRVADIRDVRLALEGAFESETLQVTDSTSTGNAPWARPLPVAAAGLFFGAVVAGVAVWLAMQAEPQPVDRFDYEITDNTPLRFLTRPALAVSRDGRQFVYNTGPGFQLRSMDSLEPRLIPGTQEELMALTFSPDGQQIAYFDFRGGIRRIPVAGGAPAVVSESSAMATNPFDLRWESDGTILVAGADGISRVAANGGRLETVVPMPGTNSNGPQLLPDGDTLLFSVGQPGNWDSARILAHSLSTGEQSVLLEGGSNPRYLPTGHLLYVYDGGLYAVAFDAEALAATGGPVPLVQEIRQTPGETGIAQFDVSDEGTLVYVVGGGTSGTNSLVWVDRDGREEDIAIEPGTYVYPRISPDGARLALDDRGDLAELWVYDFAAATRTRLTIGDATGNYPVWTPDSQRIAYNSGSGNIDWKAANDTGIPAQIAADAARSGSTQVSPYFFSPEGDAIVFRSESNVETGDDIGMISIEEGSEPVWLLAAPHSERNAELSPNGRWMAYQSNESGRYEIYVRPFPDVESDRRPVSNAGGWKPLWSRDGTELFYLEPGPPERLMSVRVDPSRETFSFEARTPIIEWPYRGTVEPAGRPYDVSLDGQKFLAIRYGRNDGVPERVVVVQNWFEELERLVPTD